MCSAANATSTIAITVCTCCAVSFFAAFSKSGIIRYAKQEYMRNIAYRVHCIFSDYMAHAMHDANDGSSCRADSICSQHHMMIECAKKNHAMVGYA